MGPSLASALSLRTAWAANFSMPPGNLGYDALSVCNKDLVAVAGGWRNYPPTQFTAVRRLEGSTGAMLEYAELELAVGAGQAWLLPEPIACNPADGNSPFWMTGMNETFKIASPIALNGDIPPPVPQTWGETFGGVISGRGTTRFLLYNQGYFGTDLGNTETGGKSWLLRYDGAGNCSSETWRTAFQIPLLGPSNVTRILYTRKLLYDDEADVFAVGLVFNGDPPPFQPPEPPSDIGPAVGPTDIFVFRFSASNGSLLAYLQLDTGLPDKIDRISEAFIFRDRSSLGPRIGLLSYSESYSESAQYRVNVIDAFNLTLLKSVPLNRTESELSYLTNVGVGAASPPSARSEPYFVLVFENKAEVLSLGMDTLGTTLANLTIPVPNLGSIAHGGVVFGGRNGTQDGFYFRGTASVGVGRPGSGQYWPVLGKLVVSGIKGDESMANETVVRCTVTATARPSTTGRPSGGSLATQARGSGLIFLAVCIATLVLTAVLD
jgi:hypothetical protein